MPIYEYDCNACGERFSTLTFSHKEAALCPSCGSADVTKLLSAFSYSGGGGRASSASSYSYPSGGGGG